MNIPNLDTADITDFQRKVYKATVKIPRGKVTTYGSLAKEIGCGSARAVGQALRRNPFAPAVPCHRVIAADLTLGGFMGKTGHRSGKEIRRKLALLVEEGVTFSAAGTLAEPSQCI